MGPPSARRFCAKGAPKEEKEGEGGPQLPRLRIHCDLEAAAAARACPLAAFGLSLSAATMQLHSLTL